MSASTHPSSAAPLTRGQRRLAVAGVAAVAVILVGVGLGVASAKTQNTNAASPGTIVCPTVADKLPAQVPAEARVEVERNLALLNTQLAEANQRLVSTVGQGGPNFVQNAIVGPLASKRKATIDRIRIAFGRRGVTVSGLDGLENCRLNANGGAGAPEPTQVAPQPPAPQQPGTQPPANAAGRIVCPTVADKLPADIPAEAQAEVARNLALLETQINEANTRLANSVGQGGPNFVQNAILGPLADKRTATIDRIRIAFNRRGVVLGGLGGLATCQLAR